MIQFKILGKCNKQLEGGGVGDVVREAASKSFAKYLVKICYMAKILRVLRLILSFS